MAEKYQKKPVIIEAVQYDGSHESAKEVFEFVGRNIYRDVDGTLYIKTLEGSMRVDMNDWVSKGVKGEFYPCKPDIFEATYSKVEDDSRVGTMIEALKNDERNQ